MNHVSINKIDVLNERRKGLRPATSLFNFYRDNVDALNRISKTKDELAARLRVSRRTISNWTRALCEVGVIKFKYSGSARLNPQVYFSGSEEDFKKAILEYETFRSDL